MLFAVFLDVDGVLNTKTTCQHTPDGYTGIDDAKVKILANAIKMYDCYEVILTLRSREIIPRSWYKLLAIILASP